jgi:phosphatidylserine/phosphatidylglycerophosphate/cardiolipin synthase-like enzyme
MAAEFEVEGTNASAPFTLKIHRGEGMALLAMNWRKGKPPKDFAGFAIEYREPGGDRFFALKNRLCFLDSEGAVNPNILSTRLSPIQKFRWVHFPRNADLTGEFVYRVTPVFMNAKDELSYGEPQEAAIELRRETYPGKLNVTFTRGFVSSQAFVDRYAVAGAVDTLLPPDAESGLKFKAKHPKKDEALAWMGFEARSAILEVLDAAVADKKAQVCVVAYDLNEPELVSRLEQLGKRVKVIIDDSDKHGLKGSAESQAARWLIESAGKDRVKRQHMGGLQHNKTIVVGGPKVQAVVCGSTNFSWRGFYVQSNNAVVLRGEKAVEVFRAGFDAYWEHDDVPGFGGTASAVWADAGIDGVDVQVAFSPHAKDNVLLAKLADDIAENTTSSLFYSLAFLYQTPGKIRDAIKKVSADDDIFVYGMSDRKVGGLDLQKPDGNVAPVSPAALKGKVPPPFKAEPDGGGGVRLHHKFVVIDFDKPTARVYLGSYNFSKAADTDNGEHLVLIRDRRVATAYVVEAIRLFDHYEFRLVQQDAKKAKKQLSLTRPPRKPGEEPWWAKDYDDPRRARDRELFA